MRNNRLSPIKTGDNYPIYELDYCCFLPSSLASMCCWVLQHEKKGKEEREREMRANMCIKRPFLQKRSVRIATHGGEGYKKSDLPSIPLTNFSSLAKMSPVKKEPHFLCDRNLAEAPPHYSRKGKSGTRQQQ